MPQAPGKLPTPRAGQEGALYMLLSDFTVNTHVQCLLLKITYLVMNLLKGGQSGDNLQELDLSFHQVGLRSQTQIINQAWGMHLSPLSQLLFY